MRLACAALLLLAVACDNGDPCDTGTAQVGDVCLPATLAPDLPSVLEVRELCGNPCSGPPTCTALFRNGAVALDAQQEICASQQTSGCLQSGCRSAVMRCVIPALPAGNYALNLPGSPARLLRVAPGGQSSCHFTLADGGVQ